MAILISIVSLWLLTVMALWGDGFVEYVTTTAETPVTATRHGSALSPLIQVKRVRMGNFAT
jgi:hypothetical protein